MKLLIHDLSSAEWEKVAADYKGWEIISDNGSIRSCAGCFVCWLKTPGKCAIKDGYDHMSEIIHNAEEVVFLSRYTYGGFSSFVKNVIDRSIGYLLPFFRIYKGEMHHKPRYHEEKTISFIFRGHGLTEEDKEKARKYAEAVRTNLNGQIKEIRFEECEDAAKETANGQGDMAVTKGKTVILNCSPRGENANSKKFLDVIASKVSGDALRLNLCLYTGKLDELSDIVSDAEKLVLGMPLYVDGIPAETLRFMETLEKRYKGIDKKVYVVANMGFFESKQIENLLSMVKTWCGVCGFEYCAGLAVGAGEMMGQVLGFGSNGPAKYVYDSLITFGELISNSGKAEDVYTKSNKFPRFLYFLAANSGMRKGGKENGLSRKDMLK